MAKPKRTVALFEVLGRDSKAISLKTPPWWYKNRPPAPIQKSVIAQPAAVQPVAVAPERESSEPSKGSGVFDDTRLDQRFQTPLGAPLSAPNDTPIEPSPAGVPAIVSPPLIAAAVDDPTLESPPPSSSDAESSSRSSWMTELRRMLTPTSLAMIASFALVLVIATFLTNRLRNKAYAYGSVSTDSLRQQPARPDVLNVRPGAPGGSAANSSGLGASGLSRLAAPAPGGAAGAINVGNPDAPARPGANPPADAGRQVGLNYVLVQSYHEKQLADNACQFLVSHGVPCTVELGVPGWRSSYCVIGTDGFTGPGSPDCQDMLEKIRALSPNYARAGSYSAFSPQVVKWKLADNPP